MRIIIGAVGRLKSGSHKDLFDDYYDRLSKIGKSVGFHKIDIIEVPESSTPKEEYVALHSKLPKNTKLCLFDERGRTISSREFSQNLQTLMNESIDCITCIIGGADGLAQEWYDIADDTLSFGKLTLPYQLVRIMVAEQLYRAATLLSGHPYHRD